jgi:hypothetical protein
MNYRYEQYIGYNESVTGAVVRAVVRGPCCVIHETRIGQSILE